MTNYFFCFTKKKYIYFSCNIKEYSTFTLAIYFSWRSWAVIWRKFAAKTPKCIAKQQLIEGSITKKSPSKPHAKSANLSASRNMSTKSHKLPDLTEAQPTLSPFTTWESTWMMIFFNPFWCTKRKPWKWPITQLEKNLLFQFSSQNHISISLHDHGQGPHNQHQDAVL